MVHVRFSSLTPRILPPKVLKLPSFTNSCQNVRRCGRPNLSESSRESGLREVSSRRRAHYLLPFITWADCQPNRSTSCKYSLHPHFVQRTFPIFPFLKFMIAFSGRFLSNTEVQTTPSPSLKIYCGPLVPDMHTYLMRNTISSRPTHKLLLMPHFLGWSSIFPFVVTSRRQSISSSQWNYFTDLLNPIAWELHGPPLNLILGNKDSTSGVSKLQR